MRLIPMHARQIACTPTAHYLLLKSDFASWKEFSFKDYVERNQKRQYSCKRSNQSRKQICADCVFEKVTARTLHMTHLNHWLGMPQWPWPVRILTYVCNDAYITNYVANHQGFIALDDDVALLPSQASRPILTHTSRTTRCATKRQIGTNT